MTAPLKVWTSVFNGSWESHIMTCGADALKKVFSMLRSEAMGRIGTS